MMIEKLHMPVNVLRTGVHANIGAWSRARDVLAGEDAVRQQRQVIWRGLIRKRDAEYSLTRNARYLSTDRPDG